MKWAIPFLISILLCLTCMRMIGWNDSGDLMAYSFPVWGDWSAHFTFITTIRERGLFALMGDNPLYQGVPFQYPFLSHLLTAWFGSFTFLNTIQATLYSSLILLAILPFVLFRFFKSAGLTLRQSNLALVLFLFLGGFQFFDSSLSSSEALTNQFQAGSVVTQPVLFEFIPQRAFLFGLILFLVTFTWIIQRIHRIHQNSSKILTRGLIAGLISGLMLAMLAVTHLHSWMVMSIILMVALIVPPSEVSRKKVFQFGVATALFSLPMIWLLLFRNPHSSDFKGWNFWNPGWAQNASAQLSGAQEMGFIPFWLYNTGLFFPLCIWGAVILFRGRNSHHHSLLSVIRVFSIAGVVILISALLFSFQPYFYDNMKLLTYAFLLISPLAAIGLDSFWAKTKSRLYLSFIIVGFILAVQLTTAGNDFWFYLKQEQSTSFLSQSEFRIAEKFKSLRRSADELVMIAPRHNHWVTTLAGNPVWMGYPGWLWSWGIDYRRREKYAQEILTGGNHAEALIAQNPVSYFILREDDRIAGIPVSIEYFKARFKILFVEDGWYVFSAN